MAKRFDDVRDLLPAEGGGRNNFSTRHATPLVGPNPEREGRSARPRVDREVTQETGASNARMPSPRNNHPRAGESSSVFAMASGTRAESALSEISAGIARLISDRWGRGPRKTRAMWADDDVLVVLLENGHTAAERTLRRAGRDDELIAGRRALREAIAPELTAVVEQATGRKVRSLLGATALDPNVSAEIFLFNGDSAARPERSLDDLMAENVALRAEGRQARARNRELRESRREL
jgi:uncharacterized protein YbcI